MLKKILFLSILVSFSTLSFPEQLNGPCDHVPLSQGQFNVSNVSNCGPEDETPPSNSSSAELVRVGDIITLGTSSTRVNGNTFNIPYAFSNLNTPLYIYNGDAKLDSIHLKFTNNVTLNSEIKVLGHPSNLIISATSSSIECKSCSFSNVNRVSLVTGSVGTNSINIHSSNSISVGSLRAPGIQSLEFFTDNLRTTSNSLIDINLKAFRHKDGYLIMDEEGNLDVGAGGVSFYIGDLDVQLNSGKITRSNIASSSEQVEFNGKVNASAISIVANKKLFFNNNAEYSTLTEALSSSNSSSGLFIPNEGISITTVGPAQRSGWRGRSYKYADITLRGKILTDKKLEILSARSLTNHALLLGSELKITASNAIVNEGSIESNLIETASESFNNYGGINGHHTEITTNKDINNIYGGVIRSNYLKLKSESGVVSNGVRIKGFNVNSAKSLLSLTRDNDSLSQGIYYKVKNQNGSASRSNLSAKIYANEISIGAKALENINTYTIEKGNKDWSAGIKVDVPVSNEVVIQAENKLEIAVENYILNSSAILGLNQSGILDINAPKLFNERYRLEAESVYYSGTSYSPETKIQEYTTESGHVSKLNYYSPPGRLYSFGSLRMSDGNAASKYTNEEFNNLFSYVEVFGAAYFNETKVTSLGLRLSKDTVSNSYSTYKKCRLSNYCGSTKINTFAESETLMSFQGGVFGVSDLLPSNSDLDVSNLDALGSTKARVIKEFLDQFEYGKTLEDRAYVSNYNVDGNTLTYTVKTCSKIITRQREVDYYCYESTKTQSIKALLDKENKSKKLEGTNYIISDVEKAMNKYIQTLPKTIPNDAVFGDWAKGSSSKANPTLWRTAWEYKDSKLTIHYKISGWLVLFDEDGVPPDVDECEKPVDSNKPERIRMSCEVVTDSRVKIVSISDVMKHL